MELNKYFKSQSIELLRSSIHLAGYNPRTISEEAKKSLKRGIKKYGLLGGIIVNKRTGMTVVSGHQRLAVMDDLNKFPNNDYTIRVDVIDVDGKAEKELNILLNNPNAMGSWDYALNDVMSEVNEQNEADKAQRQLERAEKTAHMKDVKQQVKENAQKQAENMDAYVILSFDTYEAKSAFCERFGYDPDMKFIKGEVFDEQVERVDWYEQ